MTIKRREFLKLAGAATASLLPDVASAEAPGCDPKFNEAYGVLVDTTVCIGCRKCECACNVEHKLSDRDKTCYEDKSVLEHHRRPTHDAYTVVNAFDDPHSLEGESFLKVQCMHCNAPACASACIVGALSKCDHGPVLYDAWKCIGCRYCMVACPFQIPAYEYHEAIEPRVRKCVFCADRLQRGEKPACVSICPAEALTFGKRGDLIAAAQSKIHQNPDRYVDHVYGEVEAGGTSWMYLAAVDFDRTELPDLPEGPMPDRTEKIQHGIFKSFLPPLMLYGLLGLVMHSTRKNGGKEEADDE